MVENQKETMRRPVNLGSVFDWTVWTFRPWAARSHRSVSVSLWDHWRAIITSRPPEISMYIAGSLWSPTGVTTSQPRSKCRPLLIIPPKTRNGPTDQDGAKRTRPLPSRLISDFIHLLYDLRRCYMAVLYSDRCASCGFNLTPPPPTYGTLCRGTLLLYLHGLFTEIAWIVTYLRHPNYL